MQGFKYKARLPESNLVQAELQPTSWRIITQWPSLHAIQVIYSVFLVCHIWAAAHISKIAHAGLQIQGLAARNQICPGRAATHKLVVYNPLTQLPCDSSRIFCLLWCHIWAAAHISQITYAGIQIQGLAAGIQICPGRTATHKLTDYNPVTQPPCHSSNIFCFLLCHIWAAAHISKIEHAGLQILGLAAGIQICPGGTATHILTDYKLFMTNKFVMIIIMIVYFPKNYTWHLHH